MTNANRDLVFFSFVILRVLSSDGNRGKWTCALKEFSPRGRWIVRDIVTSP
jgi:hypothetical protein